MAPSRKRRSDELDPSLDESSNESQPRRRRRSSSSSASASGPESNPNTTNITQSLVKKLVRLAISAEYSRTPIRRADISTKIFASQSNSRNFKTIFALAQSELQSKFGMQLVELPGREKADLKSRRQLASQGGKASSVSSISKSWILVSILPEKYKTDPRIVTPTNAGGSREAEASYIALYTFIISVIYLNNGVLPEAKLERYLKRVNAETYTTVGATEKLLGRMVKEGYVEKRRDTSSGEETIEWVVGPRGKVEVGIKGVKGLVKGVYGFGGTGEDDNVQEEEEELDRKLRRSLGIIEEGSRIVVDGEAAEARDSGAEAELEDSRRRGGGERGRPRRAAARQDESDDDD